MIVYHGGNKYVKSLESAEMGMGNSQEGIGTYFTPDLKVAKTYGKEITQIDINPSKFIKSRSPLNDANKLSKLIEKLDKDDQDFWMIFADYGLEVIEKKDVKPIHYKQLAKMMIGGEYRNIQIELSQASNIHTLVKAWKEVFPNIQGLEHNNFYCVIHSNSIPKPYNLLKDEIKKNVK